MKIYVGGLAFETTEQELRTAFEQFGQVASVNIVKDRATGQSRGFGFVEIAEISAGQAAIKGMNGADLGGRSLKVDQATERAPSGGFSRGGGRGDRGDHGSRGGGHGGGFGGRSGGDRRGGGGGGGGGGSGGGFRR